MAYYFGDAIAEIVKIKGTSDGHLDFSTMPEFAIKIIKKDIFENIPIETMKILNTDGKEIEKVSEIKTIKIGEEEIMERDLGSMISMLTVAIQQLNERIIILEEKKG